MAHTAFAISVLGDGGLAVASVPATPPPARAERAAEAIPLSLEQALSLAQRRSTDVDRSRRNAEIASLLVRNARTAYSPTASVTVSANQSARGSVVRSDDFIYRQGVVGNFLGGASVSANMPIDVAGIIGRQVRQAQIGEDLAGIQLRESESDAVADVHIAYLTALRAQQAAEIDERVLGSLEALLARAEREAPSVAPFLALERAGAQQSLSTSRSVAELSQDALKQSLALPLDLRLDLASPMPRPQRDPAFEALGDAVAQRADIQAATERLRQAELAVIQAGDSRRPSVNVGAYVNQFFGGSFVSDTGRDRNTDYGLSLSLRLPILNYDAGRSENSERIAELRADQARADLADQQRRASFEVRQLRSSYDRAMRRLDALPDPEAAAQALAAAERALLAAPPERAAGLLAQVTNARSAWRAAQLAAADAFAEGSIAAIRLRRAIGLAEVPPSSGEGAASTSPSRS